MFFVYFLVDPVSNPLLQGLERSLSITLDDTEQLEDSFDFADNGRTLFPTSTASNGSGSSCSSKILLQRNFQSLAQMVYLCIARCSLSGDVFVKGDLAIDKTGVAMRDNPKCFKVRHQ